MWAIDGSNVTGCASDNNTCTSTTCGAGNIGPCRTWSEISEGRYACGAPEYCPRIISNALTINILSPLQAGDTFRFGPAFEGNGPITIQGPLGVGQAHGTGTLASIVLTTRANNLPPLKATLTPSGGAVALHQLLFDSTANAYFWVSQNDGANVWELSQAFAPFNLNTPNSLPAEVTVANGDSYTLYQPIMLNATLIYPHNGNSNINVNVYHLTLGPDSNTTLVTGPNVNIIECSVQSYWKAVDPIMNLVPQAFNSDIGFFVQSAADKYGATGFAFTGGQTILGTSAYMIGDIVLDGDFVIDTPIALLSGTIGPVYLSSTATIDAAGVVLANGTNVHYNGGVAVAYGAGQIFVHGGGSLFYPQGAGKAASTFPLTGGLRLNPGGWPAMSADYSVDPVVWHKAPVDQHALVLALDATFGAGGLNMGATPGCAMGGGLTEICNYGP